MANVTLKVSKSSYEGKIALLEGYLNRLDSTLTDYQTAERELDSFMDGSDDNYEKMRENIRANIASVKKAREMCEASIKMLKDTLKDMEDFGTNLGKVVTESIDLTKNKIKVAVDAMNLIDG